MSRVQTDLPLPRPLGRPILRPLALPTEHGGWGFLFEPIVLGLIVAPSLAGLGLSLAFVFGFLTRQPLKLALQDALRGKSYPRTRWCRLFAALYAAGAAAALAAAIALGGWMAVVPIGLVAPLAMVQIAFDAKNRSRAILPELGGAVAMSSSVAAIALAGGMRLVPALTLSGVVIARSVPAIVYVRTLLQRAHGIEASSSLPLALHAAAILAVASFGSKAAVAAMVLLFARATWSLARPVAPARTIGWREIAWGAVTIGIIAAGVLF